MEREIVNKRIKLLIKNLDRLEQFTSVSIDNYLVNYDLQLIAERLFQLIVEIACDINGYLLVNLFQITPATYFESFINMSKQGIITQELANELAKSAGMRNRIVHQYDEIDQQVIFTAIPLAVSQYSLYIKQVNDFLNTLEVNNA
jgi:uncharacterized protein YutE (UPF0331/DUF86 family)